MRMDSATPPCGGAQNDSMVGGVQGNFRMKGEFSPVLVEKIFLNCRYLSVHPTKTGVKVCVSSLSHHIPSEVSGIAHGSNIYSQNDHPVTDT